LEERVFRKYSHTIPELKSAAHYQAEAISAETHTKVPNNFVFRLHKVLHIRVHHMEWVLV
jgi:hypothetical protein